MEYQIDVVDKDGDVLTSARFEAESDETAVKALPDKAPMYDNIIPDLRGCTVRLSRISETIVQVNACDLHLAPGSKRTPGA